MKKSRQSVYTLATCFFLFAKLQHGFAGNRDAFALASQNGFLKLVANSSGVYAASWRGDVVCVDPAKPEASRQFSMDFNCVEILRGEN